MPVNLAVQTDLKSRIKGFDIRAEVQEPLASSLSCYLLPPGPKVTFSCQPDISTDIEPV